jgi:succinate dehydrogenase hydrophobic anchor subunit
VLSFVAEVSEEVFGGVDESIGLICSDRVSNLISVVLVVWFFLLWFVIFPFLSFFSLLLDGSMSPLFYFYFFLCLLLLCFLLHVWCGAPGVGGWDRGCEKGYWDLV